MNARQLRLKLEPLYRKIAETRSMGEFELLACFAEIAEIRETARSKGLDPSVIDKQLAISAIEDMQSSDYLNHYHHIHFYCPHLSIRPQTFTTFEMTESMANDYLELSLMQIDQVNTADDLNEVINSADKLYLANHHELYLSYIDYICTSFDFQLPEVIHFFSRENKGSCASSLSMSLSIVHNIIADSDDFMTRHREFWDRYTTFIANYARKLHVKISAKAEDISKAVEKCGRLYYGNLADSLVVKQHDVESDFNSFNKTGLWANPNTINNYISYNSTESALRLFLKLKFNGRANHRIDESILQIMATASKALKHSSIQFLNKEDALKNIDALKILANRAKESGNYDAFEAFAIITRRSGVDQSILIDVFGSRVVLEHDMEL